MKRAIRVDCITIDRFIDDLTAIPAWAEAFAQARKEFEAEKNEKRAPRNDGLSPLSDPDKSSALLTTTAEVLTMVIDELDPFLRSSQIAKARGVSTRWLSELVKAGKFPPPDRRATKRGEPNLWRLSNVKRALDNLVERNVARGYRRQDHGGCMTTEEEIKSATRRSRNNKAALKVATDCGCYFCIRVFAIKDITEWTDDGQTALCPHCSVDTIIPNCANIETLKAMSEKWFASSTTGREQ